MDWAFSKRLDFGFWILDYFLPFFTFMFEQREQDLVSFSRCAAEAELICFCTSRVDRCPIFLLLIPVDITPRLVFFLLG
jgi:hypothetical protein